MLRDEPIERLESALQAVMLVLKQERLHEFLIDRARADLDRAGVALLYVLYRDDTEQVGLRVCDLAERLRVDAPTVSRKARQLERSGLLGRGADDVDHRAVRLRLTESGRAAIDAVLGARHDWLTEVLADWSPDEMAVFAGMLRGFADGVTRHLEDHHVR
ncbi:MarR family winged helix-turn-helix transcriptional regulator [Streptacidiphilus pinicola]|nr:MarR family transcriptional regulator [Streptacidiphilus pinicola]